MSGMANRLAEVKAHALRQKDVRAAVLAALYVSRTVKTPPLDGLSVKHVADDSGYSEVEVRFACEVLVETGMALPTGSYYRITPRGCVEIESITEKE
jgi:hypothetical protein